MGNQLSGARPIASSVLDADAGSALGLPAAASATYLPALVDIEAAAKRIEYALSAEQKAALGE